MKLKKASQILSRRCFSLCLSQGRVIEDYTFTVVDFLIRERPHQYCQILRELIRRIRLVLADSQAVVQSAVSLSLEERRFIKTRLISLKERDLEVQFKVSPEILGGLRIQIGSEILDGSVSERLRYISSLHSGTG